LCHQYYVGMPEGELNPRWDCVRIIHVRFCSHNGLNSDITACPKGANSVAKVFLRHGSQILRGVGAAIEQRCGGPRRHTPNSQAILAAGLRLYRAAIVACFVLWREFSSCGFWDFCNTIRQQEAHAPQQTTPLFDHFVSAGKQCRRDCKACASRDAGTVRLSALSALRLTTSSNLVGCWTGRSSGRRPSVQPATFAHWRSDTQPPPR
jgi:hypothetical protein